MIYKALSVRQFYGWAIIHAAKDIENRSKPFRHVGPLLIHVGKKPVAFYEDERQFIHRMEKWADWRIPSRDSLPYGGIIGIVTVVECVTAHSSKWFQGPYGLVLKNPRPLPFIECRGQLGIFQPSAIVQSHVAKHLK